MAFDAAVSTHRSRATEGGGVRVHAPPAFSPPFQFAVLPGGAVAVVDGAAYSIRLLDAGGHVLRIVERLIAPRRVTARDREHEQERRARELSDGGGPRLVGPRSVSMPAAVRRNMAQQLRDTEFARVMPVIRRMAVDGEGNLWIERTGPALDRSGGVDVVDPRGRYLGTLPGWKVPVASVRTAGPPASARTSRVCSAWPSSASGDQKRSAYFHVAALTIPAS